MLVLLRSGPAALSARRAIAQLAAPSVRPFLSCHDCCTRLRDAAAYSSSQSEASTSTPIPPNPPPKQPVVYNVRSITKDDVDISFARSSGAGGQNVNKVNTKVDMRFEIDKAGWIPVEVRDQIKKAEKNRVNKEGWLVVSSQRHRTQAQNFDDALEKIQAMIDAAVDAVTPKIADAATVARVKKNIKAGQERRLQDKTKDKMKKQQRRSRDFD